MQLVPITTKYANLIPANNKVYSIQPYVIKLDCELLESLAFFTDYFQLPQPTKLTTTI